MNDIYLTHLKSALVEALKRVFDNQYPVTDWRGIHVSIEYPEDKMQYPGIWVDFEDTQPVQIAGVSHIESDDPEIDDPDETSIRVAPFTRWVFQGYATYTITALSSLERDRLYDELVRVLAFGRFSVLTQRFRDYIEANPLIAINFDFDQIEPRGSVASPGTPWGTDEIIYERTVNMEVRGEFISNSLTGVLIPLSRVVITETAVATADPETLVNLIYDPGVVTGNDLTDWH